MMWRSTTLGEICAEGGGGIQTGPFGSQLHAADYVVHGIPSVMPQNIGDNVIDPTGIARITDEDATRLSKYLLREGDIVYSRRGDVEKRALVRAEHEGWLCGTGCLRVRLGGKGGNDPRFLSYLLGTEEVRGWIVRHAVGATMPNLNTSIMAAIPIWLPPTGSQLEIAEVLGALDDKIAANTMLSNSAVKLVDTQFAARANGGISDGKTFADVAEVGGGGTPSTADLTLWGGTIAWATPTDITALRGPYLSVTSRTITDDGLAACSSPLYPVKSILMTSRATIGAFAIAECPTAVNQGFIVVNARHPGLQWWLFHQMRARVPEFLSYANGATFLELSRGRFKQLQVWTAEDSVIAEFDALADSLHRRASAAIRENSQLASLRDTLLPELMSGRLQVKDAERVVEGVV